LRKWEQIMKHIIFAAAFAAATPVLAGETSAPEGAAVYFANLETGATVSSPVIVVFGLSGMGVAPAGIEKEMTGHHHLLLNRLAFGEGQFGEEEFELAIPSDDNHRHFGGGQTELSLDLAAGRHTLQLVLGDHNHVPHDPPVVSDVITITVE